MNHKLLLLLGLYLIIISLLTADDESRLTSDKDAFLLAGARKLFKTGKIRGAADIYLELAEKEKSAPAIYIEAARVLIFNDRNKDNLKITELGVARYPEHADTLTAHGMALFKAGFIELAEDELYKALEIDPMHPFANAYTGRIMILIGKGETAKEYLLKAISVSKEFPEFFYYLGMAHGLCNEKESERDCYENYLSSSPAYDKATIKRLTSSKESDEEDGKEFIPLTLDEPIKIAFNYQIHVPLVKLGINGNPPVYFLFDTGAENCLIDKAYAKEIGLESVRPVSVGKYFGPLLLNQTCLDSMEIGSGKAGNIEVMLFNFTGMKKQIKKAFLTGHDTLLEVLEGIQGIISPKQLFSKQVVMFDYDAKQVTIAASTKDLGLKNTRIKSTPLYNLMTGMHETSIHNLSITGIMAGASNLPNGIFIVDTGSDGSMVDRFYLDFNSIEPSNMKLGKVVDVLKTKKLRTWSDVPFNIKGLTLAVKKIGIEKSNQKGLFHYPDNSGLIGNNILSKISPITFDYKHSVFLFNTEKISEKGERIKE